jgi:hypothetical protein
MIMAVNNLGKSLPTLIFEVVKIRVGRSKMPKKYLTSYVNATLIFTTSKMRVGRLFPKLFTAIIIFGSYLGVISFRPENQSFLQESKRDSHC